MAITNDHRLSCFKQDRFLIIVLEVKGQISPQWPQDCNEVLVEQNSLWRLQEQICFLVFPACGGRPHSLACDPFTIFKASSFDSSLFNLSLPLDFLSLSYKNLCDHTESQDNPRKSPHRTIFNMIISAKFLFPHMN